ncbi:HAD family hydrolase [Sphingorhabdus sp.]|uniref:HAD family hydrolase n=1 Tax=Sphingorhabdus sp. TaxID=1902408 RepID=UPI003983CFB4
MTKITTVVFDVGKVLFEWDLRYLFAKLIDDTDELEYFVTHIVTPEWHYQHDAGRSLEDMVAERITEFPQYADLIRAYAARITETIPGPVAGTHEIVGELAHANIPLFVITNFGAQFWERFRPAQPIFDHFDDILVSGVEKLMKPDPAIYALALERFGLQSGEAIFIDDNHDNVVSARNNGFAAHYFTDAASLRTELVALNILR